MASPGLKTAVMLSLLTTLTACGKKEEAAVTIPEPAAVVDTAKDAAAATADDSASVAAAPSRVFIRVMEYSRLSLH